MLSDDEREVLTETILEHVAGRVPVIVTTTHFSTRVCVERSRRAQDLGAAMVMVMPPYHGATIRVPEAEIYEFYRRALGCDLHSDHDPGRAGQRHAAERRRSSRAWRTRSSRSRYFKIETAGAASKLRELIRLGGDAIEGPWDGEEAITLLPDLDAGATGSMTGGGYPDGIRAHRRRLRARAGATRRRRATTALAAADQLREPPVRAARRPRR